MLTTFKIIDTIKYNDTGHSKRAGIIYLGEYCFAVKSVSNVMERKNEINNL